MYICNYKCDRCDFDASAVHGALGYYRFYDSSDQFVLTTPVWCNQCETITLAEALPDISFLRTELARYMSGNYTEADREHAAMFSESLEKLVTSRTEFIRNWISRFEHRTLPGRCIECGSFSFQRLASFTDDDNLPDAFVHPDCNGTLRHTGSYIGSPATFFVLDGDGNRITASLTTEPIDRPDSPTVPSTNG